MLQGAGVSSGCMRWKQRRPPDRLYSTYGLDGWCTSGRLAEQGPPKTRGLKRNRSLLIAHEDGLLLLRQPRGALHVALPPPLLG